MLSKGNGEPQVCADNLLRTPRFSVPFERIKGIDGDLIDSPSAAAGDELVADAEWLLDTYEPRVQVNSVEVDQSDGSGNFGLVADISINTNEEDDT